MSISKSPIPNQVDLLFFECLADDRGGCVDVVLRRQNAARLKFYEKYLAPPIIGTRYEPPVPNGSTDNLPHLFFDDLDQGKPLRARFLKEVTRQQYVEWIVR